jgi:carbonic anhydrase/acetyltransferase-like protein (isoleucine patch superfamily)
MSADLWLVGCGRVFEAIAASRAVFTGAGTLHVVRLPSTDAIAGESFAELPAAEGGIEVFVAVDQSALNFARFDLYGRLRLIGYKFRTLVHPSALVDPSVQLGENCWVGPGANIGPQTKIGHNTFVGAGALIDSQASLGANVWAGAAARVGAGASIGAHSVIGADVRIADGVAIGRYCSIETPGHYLKPLPDKTYIDPLFELPVRAYGGGSPRARAKT